VLINVKITPNSSENRVVSEENGVFKVKVIAPAEEGKANKALVEVLASHFKLPKRCITIKSGLTSRLKQVIIESVENS
jgi:uncharacterized protein (TIGR00251 family)